MIFYTYLVGSLVVGIGLLDIVHGTGYVGYVSAPIGVALSAWNLVTYSRS